MKQFSYIKNLRFLSYSNTSSLSNIIKSFVKDRYQSIYTCLKTRHTSKIHHSNLFSLSLNELSFLFLPPKIFHLHRSSFKNHIHSICSIHLRLTIPQNLWYYTFCCCSVCCEKCHYMLFLMMMGDVVLNKRETHTKHTLNFIRIEIHPSDFGTSSVSIPSMSAALQITLLLTWS